MDVNGTCFHLLTGAGDWEPRLETAGTVDLWWDRERDVLTLLPRVLHFPARSGEILLVPEQRGGAASDAYGNLYWIGEDRRSIRLLPAAEAEAGDYWRAGDPGRSCPVSRADFGPLNGARLPTELQLAGLTVTREHYLVAGTYVPGGLLIFDLHGGGPPEWRPWSGVFEPLDFAAAPDGGLWVLETPARARLWRLDRHFHALHWGEPIIVTIPDAPDFGPHPRGARPTVPRPDLPSGLALAAPMPFAQPVAVEGLPDGSVLVLWRGAEGGHSAIRRYRDGLPANTVELAGGLLDRVLEDPRVQAHDFAFLASATEFPDEVAGELSLVLEDGNQALAFGLEAFREDFALIVRPRYLPLRRHTGKALVAGPDAVYYDLDQRWYPLTPQPRRRYAATARLEGLVFDGREPGCVWHRLLLDAYIPEGCRVEVYSRAGEDPDRLAELDWNAEPLPYLRGDGSEIVGHRPFPTEDLAVPGTGTFELLVQRAQGRYLELALVLAGDGRATPAIRALRVYYPRFSYLERFLPAVYREDAHSADFLDRFLANVEGIFSVVEDRIARAETYLDSRTIPADYLAWLAGWLGAAFEDDWDEARKRLLIDHAELLFRWRGTLNGLRAVLRLATETCPDASLFDDLREPNSPGQGLLGGRQVRIVERFRYRELPGVMIGDPTAGGDLRTQAVAGAPAELGSAARLGPRYRDFLERRYAVLAAEGQTAIETLNARWGTANAGFADILFTARPPEGAARLDWQAFVQRELALTGSWAPEQGAHALHLRYQEFLRRRYAPTGTEAEALAALNGRWSTAYAGFEAIPFPALRPAEAAVAEDWLAFLRDGLGFTYAPAAEMDLPLYRQFLARRYRRIDALNTAYARATPWSGFDAVDLPGGDGLPADGPALADWVRFVSLTLPIRQNAHRFTVLVPTDPAELPDAKTQRVAQVEAIVRREKPAHTDFDVKLFWALFQVGTARLGEDTVLGESPRYVAMVLGGNYLGQGLLGHGQPWNVGGRRVLGRDRLNATSLGDIDHG